MTRTIAVRLATVSLLLGACRPTPSPSTTAQGKAMPASHGPEDFAQLTFTPPAGFTRQDDTTEKRASPIPGAPPSTEHFRSYTGPAGQGLYLFHWDGFPGPDRGPMVVEDKWSATVGGEPATISRTSVFFGTKRQVLVAHFQGPAPRREQYMIYTTSLDRPAFTALLAGARWRP